MKKPLFSVHIAALAAALVILCPPAGAQTKAKDIDGWKTILATKRELSEFPADQVSLEKGLLHVRSSTGVVVRQPTADGAIRARIHFLPGTAFPQLRIRRTGEGKDAKFYMVLIRISEKSKVIDRLELNLTAPNAGKNLGAVTLAQPVALGGHLDLELSAVGNHLQIRVDGKSVLEVDDSVAPGPGYWGVACAEAWFSNIQVRSGGAAASEATGKAVATNDPRLSQLESAYDDACQRDVTGPHLSLVKALDEKYVVALDRAMDSATKSGNLDAALAFREEKARVTEGKPLPADDSATLKPLRTTYRTSLGQLTTQREQRIKPLRDKFFKELDAYQAELTRAGNIDGALAVRSLKEREMEGSR